MSSYVVHYSGILLHSHLSIWTACKKVFGWETIRVKRGYKALKLKKHSPLVSYLPEQMYLVERKRNQNLFGIQINKRNPENLGYGYQDNKLILTLASRVLRGILSIIKELYILVSPWANPNFSRHNNGYLALSRKQIWKMPHINFMLSTFFIFITYRPPNNIWNMW